MAFTNAQLWAILDPMASSYKIIDGLTTTGYMTIADTYRIGNGATGDVQGLGSSNWSLISSLGSLVPSPPMQITNNINTSSKAITNLNAYFSGTGSGTLDGYLTSQNASYGTALAKYNLSIQTALAYNYNPLTSTTTTNFLSAKNVEAPIMPLGSAVVSGTGSVTWAGYASVPYTTSLTAVNCVQQLLVSASGGTFTLSFGSADPNNKTSALAYNITASNLAAALNALPGLYGCVTVSTISGGYSITFTGNAANQNIPLLTVDPTNLTGGTATIWYSTFGGQMGFVPSSVWNCYVTTTVNGTWSISASCSAIDSTGTYQASGRTFTATLSSATSGTVIQLAPSTSGDRLVAVNSMTASGTATAGAFYVQNVMDR